MKGFYIMKQMKLRIFFMAALLAASSIVTACGDAADTKAPVTTAAENNTPVTEAHSGTTDKWYLVK
jgi:hypothetical protein